MKKSLVLELRLARISRGRFSPKLLGKKIDVTNIDYVSIVQGCELDAGWRFATTTELEEFYRIFKHNFPIFTFGKSGVRRLRTGFNPNFPHGLPEDETFYTVGSDGKAFEKIPGDLSRYGMQLPFLIVNE